MESRNRVCLSLSGTLTAAMKRALRDRYGDAVDVWLTGTRTLVTPDASWARP